MADRFLLDTSALIAFLQAEPGSTRVLELLEFAARGEAELSACFVTLTEVRYITEQNFGTEVARQTLADLQQLNV
mgnify:CR=1 FL=1